MIPQNLSELKPLRQWVNYIRIWNPTKDDGAGGYDKPPINPRSLRDGQTNNPATWADYATAAANIGKTATHRDTKHRDENGNAPIIHAAIDGAGLILAGGYCGIDYDHVIDDAGNVAPWAVAIIDRLDTYTEISPSGRGLHSLLFCGDLLATGGSFGAQFLIDAAGGVILDERQKVYELEIYAPKDGGRYFTVTGNIYRDRPIRRDKSNALREVFAEYSQKRLNARAAAVPPSHAVGSHTMTGREPSDQANKQMIRSALQAIDPGALDFGKWASIMTALKATGFSLDDAEEWSAGRLCDIPNAKNNTATNTRRWSKMHFGGGYTSAAGTIINEAKANGWKPADAFDDDTRTEYGRSLYTEEQRRNYGRSLYTEDQRREFGRQQHEQRAADFWAKHNEGFQEWKARRQAERGRLEK